MIYKLSIAGNHLADALLIFGIFPSDYSSYEEVRELYGIMIADIWIAWHIIMEEMNNDR